MRAALRLLLIPALALDSAAALISPSLSRSAAPAPIARVSAAAASRFGTSLALAAPLAVAPLAPAALTPVAPPAVIAAPLSPALAAAPAAAPLPLSLAPALDTVAGGRAFFDGAAAQSDRPGRGRGERTPSSSRRVVLNGRTLPGLIFSDQGSIAEQLTRAIDASRTSIDLALHGIALEELGDAIVRAKRRGLKVRVLLNRSHVFPEKSRDTRAPEIDMLLDEPGIEIKMLRGGELHGIMHHKFAVFDGKVLETGSFNWTHAADAWHWENALFHDDARRVAAFQSHWAWLWDIAEEIPDRAPRRHEPGEILPGAPPAPQHPEPSVRFHDLELPGQAFAPAGAAEHLIKAVDRTERTIDLANFSFTSIVLRDALVRAVQRGVRVRIAFDADQFRYQPAMQDLALLGFDIVLVKGRGPNGRGVMHNKFAVFDGVLVETGSFNWTNNAEKNNYENVLFLDEADDVAAYAAYFERVRSRGRAPSPDDRSEPGSAPESINLFH